MKYILILLMLSPAVKASEWTTQNTQFEIAYLAIHLADWGQTLDIVDRPYDYNESNHYLGKHPSRGDVNRYFLLVGAGHYLVSNFLDNEYRLAWQQTTFVVQLSMVLRNASIGLNVSF